MKWRLNRINKFRINMFRVENFKVTVGKLEIVKNINFEIPDGEIHYLMGSNGSGKSTLALGLMGYPSYQTEGKVFIDNKDIREYTTSDKAKLGLFLSMQNPPVIKGVTVINLLKNAYQILVKNISILAFQKVIHQEIEKLGIDKSFLTRYVNDGFSGGEKKKLELLQLSLLKPKVAILDEPDSGLDVDAINLFGTSLKQIVEDNHMSVLIITHHTNLIHNLPPTKVYIMNKGEIIKQGGQELVSEVAEKGFQGK